MSPLPAALAIMLFCFAPTVAAREQHVIPLDSPVYVLADQLMPAAGITTVLQVRPWTLSQARFLLRELEASGVPSHMDTAMQEFASLVEDFSRPEILILPRVSAEGYLRSDETLSYRYGYGDRRPLVEFETAVYRGDSLALEAVFDLRQDAMTIDLPGIHSNLMEFSSYDVQPPLRGYGSLGGADWSVRLGRDQLTIGHAYNSHLVVSDAAHYQDGLHAAYYLPNFQYYFGLMYLEPWLTAAERDGGPDYWEYSPLILEDLEPSRYVAFHRFDARFMDSLRVSITEGLTYGGKYPDLRLLNPMQILHSFYEWEYSSSLFSIEAAWLPVAGLELYGQYMYNQIQTAYKIERYGADDLAAAAGMLAGTRWVRGIGPGSMAITLEATHTDPWLYIRENPYISYSWRRRILSNSEATPGKPLLTVPLGFVHGPDSQMLWSQIRYDIPGFAGVRGEFGFRRQGENTILTPFDEGEVGASLTTPSGDSVDWYTADLHVRYAPVPFWNIDGGVLFTLRSSSDNLRCGWEGYVSTTLDVVSGWNYLYEKD